MNLFRTRPAYPKDRDLARVVQAAASRLADKIGKLDVAPIELSARTRELFEHYRRTLRAHIERCAHAFAWSLPRNEKPFNDLTVVAFNDGIGIFSLLAKECSIGTVIYHDSNDVLRSDARAIARAIGQSANHYVFGDTEEVEFFVKRYSIGCDVLIAADVPFPTAVRAMPRALTAFLNEISEESLGALSVALAVDERSSIPPLGQTIATHVGSLSRELADAGFDVKIVRSRGRPDVPLVLAGSRPAGTYGAVDRPAQALPGDAAPPEPRTEHESCEIQTR